MKPTTTIPGFYRARLAKGAPFVPVRIFWRAGERDEAGDLLEDEPLHCEIDGFNRGEFQAELWAWCDPIKESEYRYMVADAQHARRFRPGDPKARPDERINIARVPPEVLF